VGVKIIHCIERGASPRTFRVPALGRKMPPEKNYGKMARGRKQKKAQKGEKREPEEQKGSEEPVQKGCYVAPSEKEVQTWS